MGATRTKILIVDDEQAIRSSFAAVLEKEGFSCRPAANGEDAVEAFERDPFDIVITDIRLPGMSGVDLMRRVKSSAPDTIVILMTAYASLETAIEAVREGASDYLSKPVRFEQLALKIRNLLKIRDLEWENRVLRIEKRTGSQFDEIVGEGEGILALKQSISRIGPAKGNVIIEGESGTGKELVARALHAAAGRRLGAFVPVNCGSIPDTLLESEFFGVKRGAFTGADADKNGLFQEARGGTLFLDEVAELPLGLQPKILRAIETKEVRPLGTTHSAPVDVRIVAATNKVLKDLMRDGLFREDLFFRLNVYSITVPPLRERVGDISLLAAHFVRRFRVEMRSPVREISADAMAALETYPWKGNVRELQNVIQRCLITSTRSVIDADLVRDMLGVQRQRERNLKTALREFETSHIRRVLDETGGDKRAAAERLGISLASLYAKLKE